MSEVGHHGGGRPGDISGSVGGAKISPYRCLLFRLWFISHSLLRSAGFGVSACARMALLSQHPPSASIFARYGSRSSAWMDQPSSSQPASECLSTGAACCRHRQLPSTCVCQLSAAEMLHLRPACPACRLSHSAFTSHTGRDGSSSSGAGGGGDWRDARHWAGHSRMPGPRRVQPGERLASPTSPRSSAAWDTRQAPSDERAGSEQEHAALVGADNPVPAAAVPLTPVARVQQRRSGGRCGGGRAARCAWRAGGDCRGRPDPACSRRRFV